MVQSLACTTVVVPPPRACSVPQARVGSQLVATGTACPRASEARLSLGFHSVARKDLLRAPQFAFAFLPTQTLPHLPTKREVQAARPPKPPSRRRFVKEKQRKSLYSQPQASSLHSPQFEVQGNLKD